MKRGKKYSASKEAIGAEVYSLEDAIAKAIEVNATSFDASLEVHMNLGIDPKKGDQLVRGTVTLPHGTGKSVRVAAFVPENLEAEVKAAGAELVGGEALIAEIQKSGKTDFDVAVATPDMMKHLGKIAKILGPKGLMPNPKNDTVTPDPQKVVTELAKGKVSFRNDAGGNIHQVVGKVSFGKDKLVENAQMFIDTIVSMRPASSKGVYVKKAVVCTSMGPSVLVRI